MYICYNHVEITILLFQDDKMKELSLYKIRDLAFESGRSVYNIQQLSNLIGRPRETTTVYFNRLVERNLAKRLL